MPPFLLNYHLQNLTESAIVLIAIEYGGQLWLHL